MCFASMYVVRLSDFQQLNNACYAIVFIKLEPVKYLSKNSSAKTRKYLNLVQGNRVLRKYFRATTTHSVQNCHSIASSSRERVNRNVEPRVFPWKDTKMSHDQKYQALPDWGLI